VFSHSERQFLILSESVHDRLSLASDAVRKDTHLDSPRVGGIKLALQDWYVSLKNGAIAFFCRQRRSRLTPPTLTAPENDISRGERTMYLKLRSIAGVSLCFLGLVSPFVFAAEQPSTPLPTAQLVTVEGAEHTYQLIDKGGRVVTATVPSQSVADIKTRTPDRTVRAVVASIDMTSNQTKVVTDAGQTLVLAMAHETLAGLQVGDAFTLTASPQGGLTAVVSPRGEVAAHR
jgi:hypothetical protein